MKLEVAKSFEPGRRGGKYTAVCRLVLEGREQELLEHFGIVYDRALLTGKTQQFGDLGVIQQSVNLQILEAENLAKQLKAAASYAGRSYLVELSDGKPIDFAPPQDAPPPPGPY